MPSRSRERWETERRRALDELERAHALLSAGKGGRRLARHLNLAYTVMLSAHFQGYCRQLHSEATDHLVANLAPASLRVLAKRQLVLGRKLDAGNPNPGNLGADFGRLGLDLWPALMSRGARFLTIRARLEDLNTWRNAIAHEALDPTKLVRAMDALVRVHLVKLVGSSPWR